MTRAVRCRAPERLGRRPPKPVAEELWFGGGTPIWTALEHGIESLRSETGRRVILVLTDGAASRDARSRGDVLNLLHRIDCMVYALGFDGSGLSGAIRAVATSTGGASRIIAASADVDAELQDVVSGLHHQLVLLVTDGFSSGNLPRLRRDARPVNRHAAVVSVVHVIEQPVRGRPANEPGRSGSANPSERLERLAAATGGRYVARSRRTVATMVESVLRRERWTPSRIPPRVCDSTSSATSV